MNPQLIIALAIAASSFIGGWTVKAWQVGFKETERVESQLESQRVANRATVRREEAVIAAQNQAQALARKLRLDVAAAGAAADGLRDDLVRTRTDAAASLTACTLRVDTLGELLVTVEEAGRGMAEKADRHSLDVRLLVDAWPR